MEEITKQVNTNKIWKTLTLVLLIVFLGYLSYDLGLKPYIADRESIAAEYGYSYRQAELLSELTQCKQVPLQFNNQTVNAVLVECLD